MKQEGEEKTHLIAQDGRCGDTATGELRQKLSDDIEKYLAVAESKERDDWRIAQYAINIVNDMKNFRHYLRGMHEPCAPKPE